MKTRKSKNISIAGLLALAGLFIASNNNGEEMKYLPTSWYYGSSGYAHDDNTKGELYAQSTVAADTSSSASHGSSGVSHGGFGHWLFGRRGGS